MRKIFLYEKDGVSQVENFFSDTDEKIRSKLNFLIAYITDEKNKFTQPYVKHFSIGKYRLMYELRIKNSNSKVRVVFYEHNDEVVLIYAFYKKDNKDTERYAEIALRMLNSVLNVNGDIPVSNKKEYTCGKK